MDDKAAEPLIRWTHWKDFDNQGIDVAQNRQLWRLVSTFAAIDS